MHVRQYRPAFFEGFENEEYDISQVNEFAQLPFVKRLLDEGTVIGWTARVYTPESIIISGIFGYRKDSGEIRSFVVAFITGPGREEFLDLPGMVRSG